ncbi:hypothetical protein, partial [Candidatus Regiella insecticola]|uniref:hypothetical protein n=1 Tax=Candidatus Regiella insecticola TaxID=138073 RepID=UPI000C1F9B67
TTTLKSNQTDLAIYPMNFELRQGGKGDRPMSVGILRDSASTRRQQSRNLKGEGYIHYIIKDSYYAQLRYSISFCNRTKYINPEGYKY